jgi:hypothetical protein
VPAPPASVHVCDGGRGADPAQGHDFRASRVAGAAARRVAADVSTASGVYRRHVVAPASGKAPLFAAPEPERPLEFLAELP